MDRRDVDTSATVILMGDRYPDDAACLLDEVQTREISEDGKLMGFSRKVLSSAAKPPNVDMYPDSLWLSVHEPAESTDQQIAAVAAQQLIAALDTNTGEALPVFGARLFFDYVVKTANESMIEKADFRLVPRTIEGCQASIATLKTMQTLSRAYSSLEDSELAVGTGGEGTVVETEIKGQATGRPRPIPMNLDAVNVITNPSGVRAVSSRRRLTPWDVIILPSDTISFILGGTTHQRRRRTERSGDDIIKLTETAWLETALGQTRLRMKTGTFIRSGSSYVLGEVDSDVTLELTTVLSNGSSVNLSFVLHFGGGARDKHVEIPAIATNFIERPDELGGDKAGTNSDDKLQLMSGSMTSMIVSEVMRSEVLPKIFPSARKFNRLSTSMEVMVESSLTRGNWDAYVGLPSMNQNNPVKIGGFVGDKLKLMSTKAELNIIAAWCQFTWGGKLDNEGRRRKWAKIAEEDFPVAYCREFRKKQGEAIEDPTPLTATGISVYQAYRGSDRLMRLYPLRNERQMIDRLTPQNISDAVQAGFPFMWDDTRELGVSVTDEQLAVIPNGVVIVKQGDAPAGKTVRVINATSDTKFVYYPADYRDRERFYVANHAFATPFRRPPENCVVAVAQGSRHHVQFISLTEGLERYSLFARHVVSCVTMAVRNEGPDVAKILYNYGLFKSAEAPPAISSSDGANHMTMTGVTQSMAAPLHLSFASAFTPRIMTTGVSLWDANVTDTQTISVDGICIHDILVKLKFEAELEKASMMVRMDGCTIAYDVTTSRFSFRLGTDASLLGSVKDLSGYESGTYHGSRPGIGMLVSRLRRLTDARLKPIASDALSVKKKTGSGKPTGGKVKVAKPKGGGRSRNPNIKKLKPTRRPPSPPNQGGAINPNV